MKVFIKKHFLEAYISQLKNDKKSIGFVPTMGALHEGHLSLVKQAKEKNDAVIVSIFVNPTQFDKKEDLENYPITLKKDKELLLTVNCDAVFIPSAKEIYGQNISANSFDFDGLENEMEGKFRVGHFNGVGTIVKTLFETVKPDYAYFGKKDFQQLQIIKKMVAKENLPVNVIGCPIHREQDGLAMSSRNTRLTENQRKEAPLIYSVLKKVREKFKTENISDIEDWVSNQFKNNPTLELEYFTIADETTLKTATSKDANKNYRAFIAVFADNIRLIDNISLSNS